MVETVYYNDNNLIQPFIVSFLPGQQNTLILAPEDIKTIGEKFLLLVGVNNRISDDYKNYANAFVLEENILITLIFTTKNVEPETGRKGLNLTLGALFHKSIFKNYKPCEAFFRFYVGRFESIFDLDLKIQGADQFINKLMTVDSHHDINTKLKFLQKDLSSSLFLMKKIPSYYFLRKIFSYNFKIKFPSLIITNKRDENTLDYLFNFLAVVDNHLQKTSKINNSTLLGENGVELTTLPLLPDLYSYTKSKLVINSKGERIIAFYS